MSFFVFEGERKMRNVIEVYVENLKKYNQGILNGRWITLGIDEESLQKILKEHLGITDYNLAMQFLIIMQTLKLTSMKIYII